MKSTSLSKRPARSETNKSVRFIQIIIVVPAGVLQEFQEMRSFQTDIVGLMAVSLSMVFKFS